VYSVPAEHPELAKLRQFGVADEQRERFAVLCLPENILAAAVREDLLDSQDAVDLAKRLREASVSCATSYDLTPEAATVQRLGGDIWLGIVWVLQPEAMPKLAGVIKRKLKPCLERTDGRKVRVHLSLRIRNGQEVAEVEYAGDAPTLIHLTEGWSASEKKK